MEKQMTESHVQTKPRPKSFFRRLLKALVLLIILIVVLLALMPTLLSTGPGTRFIQSTLGNALGGTMEFGDLSLGWLSGLKIDNLKFTDLKKGNLRRDPRGSIQAAAAGAVARPYLAGKDSDRQTAGPVDGPVTGAFG